MEFHVMTTTMQKQPVITRIPFYVYAILAVICTLVLSLTVQAHPDEIRVKGWLHADMRTAPASMIVKVNGIAELEPVLRRNGRFEVDLPVGVVAELIFEMPGQLTKVVMVDTHNALSGSTAGERNKNVKFDVVLGSAKYRQHRVYAGAVGRIRFIKGSGAMVVEYERHLVAADQASN